jgi:hypothetical protein
VILLTSLKSFSSIPRNPFPHISEIGSRGFSPFEEKDFGELKKRISEIGRARHPFNEQDNFLRLAQKSG